MKLRVIATIAVLCLALLPGCSKKCKPGEDAECWSQALKDPERIDKAIDNLKLIGDKKAEAALVEAFQAQAAKAKHREKIAEIFRKWRTKSAVKAMIGALDFTVGPNKDGRKAKRTNRANQKIASALGAIGDKQAAGHLRRLMKTTKEATVRRSAIRALGKLKATEAVEELIGITEDKNANWLIRANAVYALGEIADPRATESLVLSLYRDKARFFNEAQVALVKIGEPAIELLVKTMTGRNLDAKKLNEQNVEVLDGALEANAAQVLGYIGSPKALEPLLKMAKKTQKVEEETNQMLVMTRLITALGAIGDKKGVDVAKAYLEKDYWDVRLVCANALTFIGDRTVVADLFKVATTGEHPKTRVPLIEAIGNLGTEETLETLTSLQKTERDVDVSKAIKESIKRLQAYQQCKDKPGCWIGKLKDSQWAVREKAVYELGRLQAQQAVDPLIQILGDTSEYVRFALIWSLGELKAKKAMEAIEELVEQEKGSARFKNANYYYRLLAARLSRM